MTKLKIFAGLFLVVAVVGVSLWLWWALDLRWRPHVISRHQTEVAQLLKTSGWVSPGLKGPIVYMVAYRDCPSSQRFQKAAFERMQKANVDIRVVMVARRDENGRAQSTPAERSTVAELWVNRSWALLQTWLKAPSAQWTAPGIIPADNDAARTAVVEQSRVVVDQLQGYLKDNGFDRRRLRYPTLIWWDRKGRMVGCACEQPGSYRPLLRDVGA